MEWITDLGRLKNYKDGSDLLFWFAWPYGSFPLVVNWDHDGFYNDEEPHPLDLRYIQAFAVITPPSKENK
jgi:hypothetical protein